MDQLLGEVSQKDPDDSVLSRWIADLSIGRRVEGSWVSAGALHKVVNKVVSS